MVYVLRYSFLLINVCIRSMSSWATTVEIDFDIGKYIWLYLLTLVNALLSNMNKHCTAV